jgi:cellulose synthase/poly-beta-1,6-N-acetylglucosamine synthase-like glycosyltransferase
MVTGECMRFSILIPVYNTPADLLHKCLESIGSQVNDYGQSYNDYEIILVFDGPNKYYSSASVDMYHYAEGDVGKLTFQGTRYLNFERC